jgi:Zn finger protein HypA/HybF involved in hydrogenase expression
MSDEKTCEIIVSDTDVQAYCENCDTNVAAAIRMHGYFTCQKCLEAATNDLAMAHSRIILERIARTKAI